ncbi:MAG: NAD(P)H-dependent glycerol-3-phosphate dehydrogenase, partial [Pseudomonadota bacterium]
ADELPEARIAALSGPSFAADVARDLPTAVTVAGADDVPAILADALTSTNFRVYQTDDLNGIEIGGAVKNVIAIACGIAMGRGLGDNARAALISRGLAEMVRLGMALGGRQETLMGLSGLGDLVLTATGEKSRNYSTGLALGRGESFADIMDGRASVVEGAVAAPAVLALAGRHGIEMPICAAVDDVLAGRLTVDDAASTLMMRPSGAEFDHAAASKR